MAKHASERIYDEQMAPLVERLIEVAKANKIPLFLSAGMVLSDGQPGCCTILVIDGVEEVEPRLGGAANRFKLCTTLVRGPSSLDTATRLIWAIGAPAELKSVGDA